MAKTDQPHKRTERNAWMVLRRKEGMTFTEIGRRQGISPQRVHQIVSRELAREVRHE